MQAGKRPAPKFLDQVQAFKAVDVAARLGKPFAVEVQVISLGDDVAWVSLPGEIFVELGLQIKRGSPFKQTMIAELANGAIGYVPNRVAYAQGNYEVVSARVAEGSGEKMVDEALRQPGAAVWESRRSARPTGWKPILLPPLQLYHSFNPGVLNTSSLVSQPRRATSTPKRKRSSSRPQPASSGLMTIDAHLPSLPLRVEPVEVEPQRLGVDLDHSPCLAAALRTSSRLMRYPRA